MDLKNQINKLAEDFAQGVLAAMRSASLDELVGAGARTASAPAKSKAAAAAPRPARGGAPAKSPRGRGGRLHRRSDEEIGAVGDNIIGLLKAHPEGLRAEQIRAELGLEAKELPRPLKDLVAGKKVKTKGQKRATTYFAK
ncbi:hypothetical protein LVJ94_13790 [Pendulispora rubella]|uniref:DNA-binding protein n=1 Tax=Pendulispora rubella TaxID=2741070 RepID=A0ABZ2LBK7_9BACT